MNKYLLIIHSFVQYAFSNKCVWFVGVSNKISKNINYFFQVQVVYMHTHKFYMHAYINVNDFIAFMYFYMINYMITFLKFLLFYSD